MVDLPITRFIFVNTSYASSVLVFCPLHYNDACCCIHYLCEHLVNPTIETERTVRFTSVSPSLRLQQPILLPKPVAQTWAVVMGTFLRITRAAGQTACALPPSPASPLEQPAFVLCNLALPSTDAFLKFQRLSFSFSQYSVSERMCSGGGARGGLATVSAASPRG